MWKGRSKNKVKPKDTTLKELISKSKVLRKNIDNILSAFKRIEKHMSEMQKSMDKKDSKQATVSRQIEKLIKDMKQLDGASKEKKK